MSDNNSASLNDHVDTIATASTAGSASAGSKHDDPIDAAIQTATGCLNTGRPGNSTAEDLCTSVMAWLQDVPNVKMNIATRSALQAPATSEKDANICSSSQHGGALNVDTAQEDAPQTLFSGGKSDCNPLIRRLKPAAFTEGRNARSEGNCCSSGGSTSSHHHASSHSEVNCKRADEHKTVSQE